MKIVVDVNIILSALIRDSSKRRLIIESSNQLYFPEPSSNKIIKYKDYVMEKAGLTEDAFQEIIKTLFKYIKVMPTEELQKHWNKAKEIMAHTEQKTLEI